MAKSRKAQDNSLPVRSTASIKEDESRLIFEGVMNKWLVLNNISKDFGIDLAVEITKTLSDSNQLVTAKKFSVQLKSSTKEYDGKDHCQIAIQVNKITYWRNLFEPMMLVYVDLTTKDCYYKWIDDAFVQELNKKNKNWIAQDTITIKIDRKDVINDKSLVDIEKYVFNWKVSNKSILTPGSFFKYSEESQRLIRTFVGLTERYQIDVLKEEVQELKSRCSQSIFTIAVVGLTKAGKSTLINSLLRQDISPVGVKPTTGIPITIYPSERNRSTILFKNNTEIEGGIDSAFLNKYTSQTSNENNNLNVKLVSVHLVNTFLERGFAFCDVPGLDDPDKEIRDITKTALFNVNAIIYVISVAPFRFGDFSITNKIIEDIQSLSGRLGRLFLVFNKIDALSTEQLDEVKDYIQHTLRRHGVLEYLPIEPLFISAGESFESRIASDDIPDTVTMLEEKLWEYLLGQNKTGLHTLIDNCLVSLDVFDCLKKTLQNKIDSSERKAVMSSEISVLRNELAKFSAEIDEFSRRCYSNIATHIDTSFASIINYLDNHLRSQPTGAKFIEKKNISIYLENQAHNTISEIYNYIEQELAKLQKAVNKWLFENLKQTIREDIPNAYLPLNINHVRQYSSQAGMFFNRGVNVVGILEKLLYGVGWVVDSVIEIIDEIITPDHKIKEKQIVSIIKSAQSGYVQISQNVLANIQQYLNVSCSSMKEKSVIRVETYLDNLSSQVAQLQHSISGPEKRQYSNYLKELGTLELSVTSNLTYLKSHTNGID